MSFAQENKLEWPHPAGHFDHSRALSRNAIVKQPENWAESCLIVLTFHTGDQKMNVMFTEQCATIQNKVQLGTYTTAHICSIPELYGTER
jgi:hypothetical protein